MTVLAHVSDLHFGRHSPRAAEALLADLARVGPDLVVVSGDLTQRARRAEFRAARAFLAGLPAPWLVVPGNHDIPVFDVVRRFLAPLARFRRLVTDDLHPVFEAPDLMVLGLNTARRTRWKEGRISRLQIERIRATFRHLPPAALKVLVTHHPFIPPPPDRSWTPMHRARAALVELEACGMDLLLSGHQHQAWSADVRDHYQQVLRSILVVHAGTSISERQRGEPNTYNLLRYQAPALELEVRAREQETFEPTGSRRFVREPDGWRAAA